LGTGGRNTVVTALDNDTRQRHVSTSARYRADTEADLISGDTMYRERICYGVARTINASFMVRRRDTSLVRSQSRRCPDTKKINRCAIRRAKWTRLR
jgi:hypothetical protein